MDQRATRPKRQAHPPTWFEDYEVDLPSHHLRPVYRGYTRQQTKDTRSHYGHMEEDVEITPLIHYSSNQQWSIDEEVSLEQMTVGDPAYGSTPSLSHKRSPGYPLLEVMELLRQLRNEN